MYKLILILMLLSSLFSCQAVPPSSNNSNFKATATLDNSDPRARLVLGSKSLVDNVVMANLKFRKIGLFTQAQVGIQNLSGVRYNLEYRVEWEDKSGFMVDQSGVWQRITLAPSQINTFLSTGKNPEAEHIVVNLRLPDDPFIINKDKTDDKITENKNQF